GHDGAPAMWLNGNWPVPHRGNSPAIDDTFEPTTFDDDAVSSAIDACHDPELAATLRAVPDPAQRAVDTLFHMNYFPTRFAERPSLYTTTHARQPLLDLPFQAEDFVGIVHLDEE